MIKQLLSSVREYRFPSLIAPVLVAGQVAMEVLLIDKTGTLIDNGIEAGDMSYVWRSGIFLLICLLVASLFSALSGRAAAIAGAGFANNLRRDMYYKIQDYSFSNIDKFKTSSIVTRLTMDVSNVSGAYQMLLSAAVRAPIMLIIATFSSFRRSPKLTLILVGVAPFLVAGVALILRYAHPKFLRMLTTTDQMNNVVQENVRGIRVVKSYVRENHEIKKFSNVSQSICDDSIRAEGALSLSNPLMITSIYVSMIVISWFGAKMIVVKDMSTGDMQTLLALNLEILSSLMMLSMIIVSLVMSHASAKRIVEILDEEPDIVNPKDPVMEVKDGSIDFDHVYFSYSKQKDRSCLTDIDIHVRTGETVGIIGGTGVGKSSLIQLIPRLYDVTDGDVKIGGIDVRNYDLETLRDNVSVVLQKNELFAGTIKENLRWGNPEATDEELERACEIAQADSFIRSFPDGYDTHIEQGGTNVSGGQKQRLCIARALLKKPKILILDDSTSAVDTATDAKIRKGLADYAPGMTKLIIAQRISSVEQADQIIVLDNGKISGVGTHQELLANNAIYKEVYESQKKGGDE